MPRVAALLYPEALATSVTLPAEILAAAAQLARARRRPVPGAGLELLHLGEDARPRLHAGLDLATAGHLETLEDCDLLLLPAIWRHPTRVLRRFEPWLGKLRSLHAGGSVICSVGSASNLLAAAGLLRDRPATTHWHDFDAFSRRYPEVNLKRRHLITRSDRLYCVGSVNSIADFMVHMTSQWYGEGIARSIEAQFSPEARQSFASAAFLAEAPEAHHDALVRELQDILLASLGAVHSLDSLAQQAGVSARTLSRRFRAATGQSPMHYLRALRLQEARSLLQHSDLGIGEIGWRCGFRSPSQFAQAFQREQSMPPRDWRNAVRGKRFSQMPGKADP
jgi:transcriptional regulator GlxA family with amidase domain